MGTTPSSRQTPAPTTNHRCSGANPTSTHAPPPARRATSQETRARPFGGRRLVGRVAWVAAAGVVERQGRGAPDGGRASVGWPGRGCPVDPGRGAGQRRWAGVVAAVAGGHRGGCELGGVAAQPGRGRREAGPTGFGLARALQAAGVGWVVVAPSKLERPPGGRVKTDRRDAQRLARLPHLGGLPRVRVPTQAEGRRLELWSEPAKPPVPLCWGPGSGGRSCRWARAGLVSCRLDQAHPGGWPASGERWTSLAWGRRC